MWRTEPYAEALAQWPSSGRHILAQHDDTRVVVYQAYRPAIGHFAATNGYFGGEFSLSRMSWIKPNFLWMMYRCGWGRKPDQEVVLAVTLRRDGFEEILGAAVPSSYQRTQYSSREKWQQALESSSVRLQWDPDHDPSGAPQERRAIQLGLRGEVLRRYAREWIVGIEDVSPFVAEQRARLEQGERGGLLVPRERVYAPGSGVAASLGVSPGPRGDE